MFYISATGESYEQSWAICGIRIILQFWSYFKKYFCKECLIGSLFSFFYV